MVLAAIVVISPCSDITGSFPVFIRRKQPVPYVFFTSPASKQHCPKSAACWSPAAPAIGILPAMTELSVYPYIQLDGFTSGSIDSGILSLLISSLSQHSLCISKSIVLEALV